MNDATPVIAVDALTYGYTKKQLVLKQLNMEVPRSAIYGFLGANGAGKSTTIRSILGLLRPKSGRIRLFGEEVRSNRLRVLRKVGSLIESPSIYKHLSGYDNLKIACRYLNVSDARIDEVLELVNLHEHGGRISKEYSTGMKQRLGLAMALLTDPELLILDEPTNGLDPNGILEIRNTLQHLNDQKKTIFLSSHLLSEIEKIATRVGIIQNGTMVFQGAIEELNQLKSQSLQVNIVASDAQLAAGILNGRYRTELVNSESLQVVLEDREDLPGIVETLVTNGVKLYEVSPQKDDLEKLFINLTSEAGAENLHQKVG